MGLKITGFEFDRGEWFLSLQKFPGWFWGPQSFLVSLYWSFPGSEPNNSPVSSADVMMLCTKFRWCNISRWMSSRRWRPCDSLELTGTVKSGLAAVQISTALLVKVNVFMYLVWIAYSLKCCSALILKLEAAICSENWYVYKASREWYLERFEYLAVLLRTDWNITKCVVVNNIKRNILPI